MTDAALKVVARRVTMAIRAPAVQRLTVKATAPVRLTVKPRTTIRIGVPKQGPPGPQGPKGDVGPTGPAGGNRTYSFAFANASSWLIAHNLGRFPSVTTLDTAGEVFVGDVTYPDANTVLVTLSVPVSGTAYLN